MNDQATLTANPTRAQLTLEQAIQCARIGEDNKARDILVLDLRGITPIFDYFVIMTGGSRRQLHTLAEETDAYLRSEGEKRLSIQGYQASRWIVQDYGDLVVHVFDQDSRDYYALEELWADAPHIDWRRGEVAACGVADHLLRRKRLCIPDRHESPPSNSIAIPRAALRAWSPTSNPPSP